MTKYGTSGTIVYASIPGRIGRKGILGYLDNGKAVVFGGSVMAETYLPIDEDMQVRQCRDQDEDHNALNYFREVRRLLGLPLDMP